MAKNDALKEYVLKKAHDNKIKFIRLWFSDVQGMLKSFSITIEELEGALSEGMGFDGSSIEGFSRIEESDVIALPDPSTFQILPWSQAENGVARMFCDILEPNGKNFEGDTRWVLKRNLKKAADLGYTYYVGPELEYFYFKSEKNPEPLDYGGYFDVTTPDIASNLRRTTILYLESMGIGVEYSHHEVAPSQHEIDLRYTDALTMADNAMTYRMIVKEVAARNGFFATFMPKPIFGENGSGMHTHQSLFKGDKNMFFDAADKYSLSAEAKYFIAGLLKHSKEICAITNQWVNSYKRLVPGYEAPVYISWARRNRSTMVRVPMYKPGKEKATRIEFRCPDPACNPYLAFSVMLAAGLEGIRNKYPLADPVEENIFEWDKKKRESEGMDTLPDNLFEAVKYMENSKLVKDALGEHVFTKFIENKHIEWDRYRTCITDYEIKKYMPIL
jgi:glutamine synthetase